MFKNRFVLILAALSMLLVTVAVSQPFSKASTVADSSQPTGSVIVPVTADNRLSDYHQRHPERNREAAQRYIMDSATRSYIAWGQAMKVRNAMDSGTRSYIAWGEALQAAGKLGNSGACSTTSQENIFASIPTNLDSATRSYIAWGLALQAKDNNRACQ